MSAPHHESAEITVYHGDCLDVLRDLPDATVDAVVTDPPYGLGFMGKEWDAKFIDSTIERRRQYPGDPSERAGENGGYRSAAAEAGRYDQSIRGNQAFQAWCEVWARECLRVLKPGGHLLASGGSRTWHRMACAIEDAGFEIRDSIAWLYGSGFPKSLDVSKAIDKARRRDYVLAAVDLGLTVPGNNLHDWTKAEHSPGDAWWEKFKSHLSPEDWQQLERAVVGNGSSGATAGMQLLGPSGIKGGEYDITAPATPDAERWQGWGTALKPAFEPIMVARKPLAGTVASNVMAHGTGALNIDGCRVATDEDRSRPPRTPNAILGGGKGTNLTASESNPLGRWPANVVLDESQATALDEQSGESVSNIRVSEDHDKQGDTWTLGRSGVTPRGVADQGGASRFFYTAKAPGTERVKLNGTAHPTVKPLSLMRWLVRLVTPPGGTVLEPFAGSGTTVEACILEGFRCVAIEREAEYLPLIVQRINRRRDPVEAVKASGEDGGLFDLFEEPA